MALIPLNFQSVSNDLFLNKKTSSQSGFALLTTLLLTVFILLLLLLISSLVRLEKQSFVAGIHQKKARSFALLGIKNALGELQQATGKDQVTTATADLFVNSENSLGVFSPFWVGVWDTKNAWESDPDKSFYVNQSAWDQLLQEDKLTLASRWLISGEDYKPTDQIDPTLLIDGIPAFAKMASIPEVRGLTNAALSEAVFAPKEFIRMKTDKPIEGTYAWWISDEGVKAKVNVLDKHWDLQEDNPLSAQYRANLSQRPAPDLLISEDAYNPSSYQNLLDLDMLSYFDTLSTPPPEGQTLRQDYFFDFTPFSFGVLSDPRQGGLKKDLSIAFDIPEAFTKDVDGLLTFDPEKLDPFFHRPTIDQFFSRDHPDYRDNYLYLLEDVVFESDHDLYEGIGGEDPVVGPPWNLLAYHHNLYQKTNEDTINLLPLFCEDTPAGYWHGSMAVASTMTPDTFYKAQSKSSYLYDKWGTDLKYVLNQKDESVTYPVSPMLTEFQLSIEIEYAADGEIIVHYIPILELTNPYDIEITVDGFKTYELTVFGLHTLIDFKLTPNSQGLAIGLSENIWSKDVVVSDNTSNPYDNLPRKIFTGGYSRSSAYLDTDQYHPASFSNTSFYDETLRGRLLNNMTRSQVGYLAFPRTTQHKESQDLTFSIGPADLGNFAPGEVKKYIYNTKWNEEHNFYMVPGDAYTSRTRELRSYTLRTLGGKLFPQYLSNNTNRGYSASDHHTRFNYTFPTDNALWPSHPSYYDQLEIEVLSAPAFGIYEGDTPFAPNVEIRQYFNYNGKTYQTGTIDLRPHQLRKLDGSKISSDPKAFTLSRGEKVLVLTMRMYLVSENEMGEIVDKDHFLGASNPRAIFQTVDSGLEDKETAILYVPNFRFELDEEPASIDISTFGSWGKLNADNTNAQLFHVPRNRPLSIGDYRHANLSLVAHEPTMPLGNSLMPPFGWSSNESDTWKSWLSSETTVGDSSTNVSFGDINLSTENEVQHSNVLIDTSYHINSALWDSYFLSTLTLDIIESFVSSDASDPLSILPNSRIVTKSSKKNADMDTLSDFKKSAGELIVDGAFNVNSTSVKAWGALLRSMQEIRSASSKNPINDVFLRNPLLPTDTEDEWSGANSLDSELLYNSEDTAYTSTPKSLAAHIVQQVKARGPFLSLAHFVNRNLIDGDDRSKAGALHQAIEESQINGSQNPFAPGSLSQADLMGVLGSSLASRSDTFVIRAKGESIESLTGEIKAEAWCEAVVQRLPDYMDESQTPDETGENLNSDNLTYGRRYHITSIRWLSKDEI